MVLWNVQLFIWKPKFLVNSRESSFIEGFNVEVVNASTKDMYLSSFWVLSRFHSHKGWDHSCLLKCSMLTPRCRKSESNHRSFVMTSVSETRHMFPIFVIYLLFKNIPTLPSVIYTTYFSIKCKRTFIPIPYMQPLFCWLLNNPRFFINTLGASLICRNVVRIPNKRLNISQLHACVKKYIGMQLRD